MIAFYHTIDLFSLNSYWEPFLFCFLWRKSWCSWQGKFLWFGAVRSKCLLLFFSYIKGFVMVPQVSSLNQGNFYCWGRSFPSNEFYWPPQFGLCEMILVDKGQTSFLEDTTLFFSHVPKRLSPFLAEKLGTSVICLCLLDVQTEAAASGGRVPGHPRQVECAMLQACVQGVA